MVDKTIRPRKIVVNTYSRALLALDTGFKTVLNVEGLVVSLRNDVNQNAQCRLMAQPALNNPTIMWTDDHGSEDLFSTMQNDGMLLYNPLYPKRVRNVSFTVYDGISTWTGTIQIGMLSVGRASQKTVVSASITYAELE